MSLPPATLAAIFPRPVPVEGMNLQLGPATLCHLAAIDHVGCDLTTTPFKSIDVIISAYILSLPSLEIEADITATDGPDAIRKAAITWGAAYPLSCYEPLKQALVRCINESFETALPAANPTAGAAPG